MGIKFSVGVSEAQADRLLLEERRQSPDSAFVDEGLEERAAGWPLHPAIAKPEDSETSRDDDHPGWAW